MRAESILKLIFSIVLSHAAGLIGAVFTTPAIPVWYAGLIKPEWAPPNAVFGPVWATLYTLMGIALFLVWQKDPKLETARVKSAVVLFILHLFFNAAWSILFFGLQNPLLGLIDIIFVTILVAILIREFWRVRISASLLLIPYFVWLLFATSLNHAIVILN